MSKIAVNEITDEQGSGRPSFTNGVQTSNINGGQVGGRRNLIINGAMQVAQRGTSGFTNDTDYTLDRWWMIGDQVSQSTEAPDGFSHSLKLEVLSSGVIGQPIELSRAGSAAPFVSSNKVTLSFYIRTDSGVGEVDSIIKFRDSKFSGSNESVFGPVLTTSTDQDWNRVIHTFTVPAINNTNEVASLEIFGVTKTSYITGVQLEVGDTATEFEHRSFGEELALCQRYYRRLFEGADADVEGVSMISYPNDVLYGNLYFETPMRSTPSGTLAGIDTIHLPGVAFRSAAVELDTIEQKGSSLALEFRADGTDIGTQNGWMRSSSSGGLIELDAEL